MAEKKEKKDKAPYLFNPCFDQIDLTFVKCCNNEFHHFGSVNIADIFYFQRPTCGNILSIMTNVITHHIKSCQKKVVRFGNLTHTRARGMPQNLEIIIRENVDKMVLFWIYQPYSVREKHSFG